MNFLQYDQKILCMYILYVYNVPLVYFVLFLLKVLLSIGYIFSNF